MDASSLAALRQWILVSGESKANRVGCSQSVRRVCFEALLVIACVDSGREGGNGPQQLSNCLRPRNIISSHSAVPYHPALKCCLQSVSPAPRFAHPNPTNRPWQRALMALTGDSPRCYRFTTFEAPVHDGFPPGVTFLELSPPSFDSPPSRRLPTRSYAATGSSCSHPDVVCRRSLAPVRFALG